MVEKLRPDLLQREVNVKADGVQTAFRKVRASAGSYRTYHPTRGFGLTVMPMVCAGLLAGFARS